MKTLIRILAFCTLSILFYGCNSSSRFENKYDGSKPSRIVITGKILNPFEDIYTVSVIITDPPTARQLTFTDDINFKDSTFNIAFERYLPQNVMIKYGTIFNVFVHPGDSLHIELDTKYFESMSQLYDSLKFTGDPAEFNSLLAIYYSFFHQNMPDFYKLYEFQQTCTSGEIIHFRDSIRQLLTNYLMEFESCHNPSDELKTFLKYDIEMDYVNNLAMYPVYYARANRLNQDEAVPLSFYDFLKIPLPKEALINTKVSRYFINRYRFGYVSNNLIQTLKDEKAIIDTIINDKPKRIFNVNYDSALIHYTVEITNDPLVLQLSLCEAFSQNLGRMDLEYFDSFRNLYEQYVTEPFLKEPLLNYYNQIKVQLQNPDIASKAVINDLKNTTAEKIYDQILEDNKGKVIYLDCWAVWCGPCRSEMPNSKDLMNKFNEDEVSFTYLCIDSEEKKWKALLSEWQLEGTHYFADKDQSTYLRKGLSISGVPHYILIDRNGNITESGFHLRPGNEKTYEKIQALVSEE